MHAHVRFRLPDGSAISLGPGDLVGRLTTAALHLSDSRISEAHAMVSLRGRALKLLTLRGMFAIDGKPVKETTLTAGQEIELAPGLKVIVEDVSLPEEVLALEADGLGARVLVGATSVYVSPRLSLAPRHRGDAAAHIWNTGDAWVLRIVGQPPRLLEIGDSFELSGHVFRAVGVALERASQPATHIEGAVQRPLTIVANYETAHILRDGQPAVALDGTSARIVSELVALGGPAHWRVPAQEIWSQETDAMALRRKWDVNLGRLRRKLRAAGVRTDLVRSGGRGKVELLLYSGDAVEDRT